MSLHKTSRAVINEMNERYRWRPIAELHEDFGSVVGININDPGYIVIVHANDMEPDVLVTHFTRFALLGQDEVERMKAQTDVDATGTADDNLPDGFVRGAESITSASSLGHALGSFGCLND